MGKLRKKILIVFGTRPEAIKMAPLVKEFKKYNEEFCVKVCVTAQHRQMLDQVLDFFGIIPDYDLNLMKPNQTLNDIWVDVLLGIKPVLENFCPDYVFVHGDTATSTATALAAYFAHCKVAHVEAGLRTWNKWAPFPEEMNRQITGRITDVHFAPTEKAVENLLKESINKDMIYLTGNTVIDALYYSTLKVNEEDYINEEIDNLKSTIDLTKDIILVTGHRRENFGKGFVNICNALKDITEKRPNTLIVYPVHTYPNVQEPVNSILKGVCNIQLISPLGYPAFVWLMDKVRLIITDSGGVQEEAPSLGKPVLVMRETTERPEAVDAGTVVLVGTNRELIVREALDLLDNSMRYKEMSHIDNPYGDGQASVRIVNYLR